MLYLNEDDFIELGIDWEKCIGVIEETVLCMKDDDYAQPVKPYLRYRDPKNRIIAMPSFVGGKFNTAGIKWIASFPDNIKENRPRANSTVILNNADNGEVISIINTALLSVIRTSSVSGLIIKYLDNFKSLRNVNIGIIGWGPIGQYHFKMCNSLLGNKISKFFLYDKKGIDINTIETEKNKICIVDSWEEAYEDADIFITCTVSKVPYINKKPKAGSLQLNVSLRDFEPSIYDYVKDAIIVDDWDEVCRENTDIEMMHIEKGLTKNQTKTLVDVVCNNTMQQIPVDMPIMFNPMGMATFDIAIAKYYYEESKKRQIGTILK